MPTLDSDHRLLLKQSKPLLQSRNAAVSFFKSILYNTLKKLNSMRGRKLNIFF